MSDQVLNYLKQNVAFYAANWSKGDRSYFCIEDFVLDRGVTPTATEPLDEEQYEYLMEVAKRVRRPLEPKQCFHNSQMLVMNDFKERMQYFEGYAYTGAIPVHHAWIELDGKLVDVTRSTRSEAVQEFLDGVEPQADLKDRILGNLPEGWFYLGVPFDRLKILDYAVEHGETNSHIDNWREGHPVFKWDRVNPLSDDVLTDAETMKALNQKTELPTGQHSTE